MVIVQITVCFTLHKKVKKSYIKTYRWLKRIGDMQFRTALEVLAPNKRSLRVALVLIDLAYSGFGFYGIFIYNFDIVKLEY